MTDRERFLAALFNGPLRYVDALFVLTGDGTVRLDAAVGSLWQQSAMYAVVSGGVDDPPYALTAEKCAEHLVENGLAPNRIILDSDSQNTRDSAEYLATICRENEWNSVMLVTSPYHMPRAFLTVLASLQAHDLTEDVLVLPLPADAAWWAKPEGLDVMRMDLLGDELAKISIYQGRGHVASYKDGLAYLREWEGVE